MLASLVNAVYAKRSMGDLNAKQSAASSLFSFKKDLDRYATRVLPVCAQPLKTDSRMDLMRCAAAPTLTCSRRSTAKRASSHAS